MKKYLLTLLVFLLLLPTKVHAQEWHYPMDRYFERQTLKGFGQLIDDDFYKGKESLFPFNRFYGYHAAVDLEMIGDERKIDVPIYAVTTGKVKFIGNLQGYGGVILQDIGDGRTALYGHVKTARISSKVGDEVGGGKILTYLGDEFSAETSKERKHLHFGIYKGKDLYFKGHELSHEQILSKWEDPNKYLKEKGVRESEGKQITGNIQTEKKVERSNFLDLLKIWLKKLFQ